ncbi:MAG: hypothetical protein FWH54_06115 [Methanobrevibacter sp.]|nr:hypothetical protein [Methanobrevibacter sp.]
MTDNITVPWDVWADGEKRYKEYLKNKKTEPNYVTIEGKQVILKDWKDSQNRVNKFKKENKNKNPKTVQLTISSSTEKVENANTLANSITVSWEVWIDGEKRYKEYLKNKKTEPNYVTIEGKQVIIKDWKDSQNRVNKFKQDNKNKNPKTVQLTISSSTIKVEPQTATKEETGEESDTLLKSKNEDDSIIIPPNMNKGVETKGYYYCSCGEKGYSYGRWKVTFVNRCAHADDASHKYKSSKLKWSDKKDVAALEGQWTCEGCDADYCAVTGKEKLITSSRRLVKVKEVKMP